MDWNWYFSTLSQSAAGIVGIIGAFVITKILNNQSEFLRKSAKLDELLAKSRRNAIIAQNLTINSYLKKRVHSLRTDYKSLCQGEQQPDVHSVFEKINFPIYLSKKRAYDQIREWSRIYRAEKKAGRNSQSSYDSLGVLSSPGIASALGHGESYFDYRLHEVNNGMVGELRKGIDEAYIECRYQVDSNLNHFKLIEDDPESSDQIRTTVRLLFGIFLIGVIFPITLLPYDPEKGFDWSVCGIQFWIMWYPFKNILLIVVTVFFYLIVRQFQNLNDSLRYSIEDVSELEKYSQIATYSEYFKIRNDHAKS